MDLTVRRDAGRSFFRTGGTMSRDAESYVPRRADSELYDALTEHQFCYVLTSRQMGKSSLMVRTAARLRKDGWAVAMLDLTAFGHNLTPEQWYDAMRDRLGRQLGLEDESDDYWRHSSRTSPLQRWFGVVTEVALPRSPRGLLIFIDEIDFAKSLPFSTDELFAAIRECYNRRTEDPALERLSFCLLGVATPSDLIRDTRTTPFNIGRRIELTDFTAEEALALARAAPDPAVATALLDRVLYWTAGHPYLTQRLCHDVSEDQTVDGSAGVDRLCEELFLSTRARATDDNLLFVRERVLHARQSEAAAVLDLYRNVLMGRRVGYEETNPIASILRLSGIVRIASGRLHIRNRIYRMAFDRHWATSNLPDQEQRRQQAAYIRGLVAPGQWPP